MSSVNALNQKEYLKKYLGIGKAPGEKKKKKKKEKLPASGLKIIDDDVDDYNISKEIQEDIEAADEDAPQIVAVIDDRPPSLRVDEKTNSLLWEPLGGEDDVKPELPIKVNSFQLKKTSLNTKNVLSTMKTPTDISKKKIERDIKIEQNHLPRNKEGEISQRRKTKMYSIRNPSNVSDRERGYSSDDSSPRTNDKNLSVLRVIKKEPDNVSPPRKKHPGCTTKETELEKTLQGWTKEEPNDSDGDISPLRKKNRSPSKNDTDISLKRKLSKYRSDENNSSPRKSDLPFSSSNKNVSPYQGRNRYHRNDEDMSPPRKKQHRDSDGDISPPGKRDTAHKGSTHLFLQRRDSGVVNSRKDLPEQDMSPPRKKRNEDDLSPRVKKYSPPRKRRNISPTKRMKNEACRSPDREKSDRQANSRWDDWSPVSKKPEKTMSGKRAGLQVAKELNNELAILKEKEDEIFQSMSEEVSGKNATTVVRRQRIESPEEVARKLKREQEMKEKYDRWGKGLKQVENENQKMADQLYEMSKPLARYADDDDLEKYLKDQEREGDPMLDYIRKKKKKNKVETGITDKPMYMGELMPNRFGIRPGYRWDGVDRSNEYEKRWFEKLNAKKAIQEEAFKWSTGDM